MQTLLIDGNNMAYRCNSVSELSTKDGRRTSAIYGVLNSIPHDIKMLNDTYDMNIGEVVVVWDFGKNKRRTELYPMYKGNRKHTSTEEDKLWYEEFITQTSILHNMLGMVGVKSLKIAGQEADDVIYSWISVAKKERTEEDNKFIIVSTDEDFLQLIDDEVNIYSPVKKVFYTRGSFSAAYGMHPEQFISYKVLKGDSSDNIPGIQGIGDITSKKLVNQYGNLNGILSHPQELLKSKVTSRIFTKEGLETLDRNNKLINLIDYVDISETKKQIEEAMAMQPSVDDTEARKFLMEYQLSSLLIKYKEWIRLFKSVNSAYYDQ